MDLNLLARVLAGRGTLARRDTWTRGELIAYQDRRLAGLRRTAAERSAFYRREHAGLHAAPLLELPPVTKEAVMAEFDGVLTTRDLSLDAIERRLRDLATSDGDPGRPLDRRWWVAATAGTTGRRGVFVWDRSEWACVLVSYARATHWAGVRAGLFAPLRMAVVSSRVPTHQSAVVGASLRSRTVPTLRLDARSPIAETVTALNEFQPRVLVGYPSVLRPLAGEQLAGSLRIAPEAVMSASEVLSPVAALEMERAWSCTPNDVYAATETAGISSQCRLGRRHVYEDLVIVEPVDGDGAPVPDGTPGDRLLVTVLFARTLPLIRYELSDRVALDPDPCACGLPFRTLAFVEGRREDVLTVPGRTGPVLLHPNTFHGVLDSPDVEQWQVEQRAGRLHVRLVAGSGGLDHTSLRSLLATVLASAGARVEIDVELVATIPRTALGKSPLIRRQD